MYFFSFDQCIFRFVEKTDRGQCPICLNNKDIFHIRRIAQADTLAGKPIVYFVFDLVNYNDTVSRNTAFDLQEKIFADIICRKSADLFRLREEAVLGRHSPERSMRRLVIPLNIRIETATQFIQ